MCTPRNTTRVSPFTTRVYSQKHDPVAAPIERDALLVGARGAYLADRRARGAPRRTTARTMMRTASVALKARVTPTAVRVRVSDGDARASTRAYRKRIRDGDDLCTLSEDAVTATRGDGRWTRWRERGERTCARVWMKTDDDASGDAMDRRAGRERRDASRARRRAKRARAASRGSAARRSRPCSR